MSKLKIWILLFICILIGGACFRLWRLSDRPMHTDEAVHAEKFGPLLERGFYAYDPQEFHGPTLNYLTLVSALVKGQTTYRQIDETTLRIIPAIFGIFLIMTPLFFLKELCFRSIIFCCALIAFSPAFIYYSRYYIQETLLVFFTAGFLGTLWHYLQTRKVVWIILAGFCVGLMHATKETFIFSLIATAVALAVYKQVHKRKLFPEYSHLFWAFAAMIVTSMTFYSSFGSNPDGILDSIRTYAVWIKRAGGQSIHAHPWYYYFDLLTWVEFFEPITWNEDGIFALACIGIIIIFCKKRTQQDRLWVFITIYTLSLMLIYSIIPYKTPWSMMTFLYGMALIAGITASWLLDLNTGWSKTLIWCMLLIYGLFSPVIQSWMLNFEFSSNPINPYVYAHTNTDIFKIIDNVHDMTDAADNPDDTNVFVISGDNDYWPFPWYLRSLPSVGYWSDVDESVCEAPIIITRSDHMEDIINILYTLPPSGQKHLYVPLFDRDLYLRPAVQWEGLVRKELWDRCMQNGLKAEGTISTKPKTLESVSGKNIKDLVKFSHKAMNTNFEIFIQHEDGTYAARAARAAFDEVDRLEELLSLYIENSDVSRINALSPGEKTVIDEDTFRCLQIAEQAWELSNGVFDITVGKLIQDCKDGQASPYTLDRKPSMQMLQFDAETLTVKVTGEGLSLDMGGIGKGYAVDKIAGVLKEWGIDKALVHGGASSVLALAPPNDEKGWPVNLINPRDHSVVVRIELANEVISCSGLEQGAHIINPFSGKPVTDRKACWVRLSENSTLADALSTACILMQVSQIEALREKLPSVSVIVCTQTSKSESSVIKLGNWVNDSY